MEFRLVDADNHFYEAEDAFTRFGSSRVRDFVQWRAEGKRRHIWFGNRLVGGTGNPTFDPVARPGAFHDTLKELQQGKRPSGSRFGDLEAINPAYRDRDVRLATMDEQGIERAILFATLGLSVEGLLADDLDMLYELYRAFNEWVDTDWGFNYRDRIYAPPLIPLADVDRAVVDLEWALGRGARVITLTPGPAYGRSPADPYLDPFWARVDEAGLLVTYHAYGGQPEPYETAFRQMWARPPVTNQGHATMLEYALYPLHRPVMDTMIALVLGNLFGRFPNVKVASIENGSAWVPFVLYSLDHAGTNLVERRVETFDGTLVGRPSDIFKQRIWVSPFPEEDIVGLAGLIGTSQVVYGSDWPHPEGMARPGDYVKYLDGLDERDVHRIMRGNALSLLGPVME
jgi:predicted TIM-barrel fold metal-dependent hydrolase